METSHKIMSIEEVDQILALEKEPPSKWLAYFMWGVIIFFWIYGGSIIALNIASMWSVLGVIFAGISTIFAQYSLQITIIIIAVFLIMLISAILYLKILYKIARELLHLFFIGLGILIIAFGGLIIAFGGRESSIYGIIVLAIGMFVLILYIVFREKINLAGRMIEVSAKAVNDEKGAIVAVLLKAIFIFWTFVAWMVSLYSILTLMPTITASLSEQSRTIVTAIVGLIVLFLGIWSLYYLEVFFNAIIVRIIHDWYRSPQVDVASLKKGFAKAFEVSGALAKFAILYATLYLLIQAARSYATKGRGAGAIAAAIVARILDITEDVIRFLGFYAVPAIVIRKAGFKDAFRDSIHKLRDLFIETIAGSFAFGFVTGFVAFMAAGVMGGIGYLLGYLILSPIFDLSAYASLIGIVTGIAFFFLAMIPIGFATSAVSIAWKTMLYEFGLDIEFAMKGIALPSRLPEDLKEKFNEILAKKGLSIPTPVQAVQ